MTELAKQVKILAYTGHQEGKFIIIIINYLIYIHMYVSCICVFFYFVYLTSISEYFIDP